jgi:putative transport protein
LALACDIPSPPEHRRAVPRSGNARAPHRVARWPILPAMIDLLVAQPMLLLFLVLAVGYAAGRVSAGGVQLGIAAVLFAGLAAGALDPRLALPEFVRSFGLVLFVYAVGVSSGPGFVTSLRRRGLRDTAWTVALLAMAAGITALAQRALGLPAAVTAGLFCGALTNTPALAAVLERLPAGAHAPVVGYSVAYPMGALGIVLALAVARRRWRADLEATERAGHLDVQFMLVRHEAATTAPVKELLRTWGIRARFVRRRRAGHWALLNPDERLAVGDLVTAVGLPEALRQLAERVGEVSEEHVELDRSDLDFRRIFVSEHAVAGRSLAELKTLTRFGALVTRVRRGDVDLVPDGRTVLELGDRVRVVAPRERMAEISRFFGDSYRALGEIDAVSFGLGAGLGLLLGLVSIPLPGGGFFRLGPAGGPLVMGLVLGALGRTGPLVWQLPYSASLTLRQLGLALFLAAVGVSAGTPFVRTLGTGGGLPLLAAGAVVTLATAAVALWSGRALLRTPAGVAMGMASGVHTQPAGLAFANDAARDESPNVGYASVSPVATVTKILLAQLLLGGGR